MQVASSIPCLTPEAFAIRLELLPFALQQRQHAFGPIGILDFVYYYSSNHHTHARDTSAKIGPQDGKGGGGVPIGECPYDAQS